MGRIFSKPNVDIVLLAAIIPLFLAGLVTMKDFGPPAGGEPDYFFNRQLIWIAIGAVVFFAASSMDWRILRNGWLLFVLYLLGVLVLVGLLFAGETVRGTRAWIGFGLFSLEPAEPIKLVLILLLAKYFSRRHVEIAHAKHIIVSGLYSLLLALLVFLQPDLGSALIFGAIWLGMILVSGVSKRHLLAVLLIAVLLGWVSWVYILEPYQQARILTFLDPFRDPRGAGYNALQSMIAVGSGGVFGRGVGYGIQSRLEFLPEHETDFIFAAFAEEWGLLGVTIIFIFFGLAFWRILKAAGKGESNFEKLFGIGLFFMLFSHFVIHVGMNIGFLPVTGISLSFLSYGGSHTITILAGLGVLMGMARYGREAGGVRQDKDLTLI